MKKILILFISIILFLPVFALEQTDSLKTKRLDEVIIKGKALFDMERLTPVEGTNIWSGKKNEVINVQNLNANIAEKTPRQIFAKVPGVCVCL